MAVSFSSYLRSSGACRITLRRADAEHAMRGAIAARAGVRAGVSDGSTTTSSALSVSRRGVSSCPSSSSTTCLATSRRRGGSGLAAFSSAVVHPLRRSFSAAAAAAQSAPQFEEQTEQARPRNKNDPQFDITKLRNVAIIAHVDHGKTTLVDEILRQSGMSGEWKSGARHLDSNDLERERGITILSKVTRIEAPNRNGYVFNIVDTPGHADFGGEVERVLSMVEGVVLLVDAAEGPKTQTKFVLQKALQNENIRPLVVINKIDKPGRRAPGEVENEIFDLFVSLDANEDQLDYPTLYASGRDGWCCRDYEQAITSPPSDLSMLFETIEERVRPPASPIDKPFSMLVSQFDALPQLGHTATGKIATGRLARGDKLSALNLDGSVAGSGKVKELTVVRGLKREKADEAIAGDLVSVSVTGFMPRWTQTLVNDVKQGVEPIQCTKIDPAVVSVSITSNNSPLAGRDGKFMVLHDIHERLKKEMLVNVAITCQEAAEDKSSIRVNGRGELQLGILIEEMRREGYEMTLSPPSVITSKCPETGAELDPWELIDIECPQEHSASIMERMTSRFGDLKDMITDSNNMCRMSFEISSRCFFGVRSWIESTTAGQAVVASEFLPSRPRDRSREPKKERSGVFVSNITAGINPVEYAKLALRGRLFIGPTDPLYEGMIMGEMNTGSDDISVSICKKHDGYAKAPSTGGCHQLGLEEMLSYIEQDECLEVTPKRVNMRKVILCTRERAIQAKHAKKLK